MTEISKANSPAARLEQLAEEAAELAGWRNSKGAQIERLYALGSGMEITHERRTP